MYARPRASGRSLNRHSVNKNTLKRHSVYFDPTRPPEPFPPLGLNTLTLTHPKFTFDALRHSLFLEPTPWCLLRYDCGVGL